MIKLFRNIRKTLLIEGKTANYIKYAIGEIVLVVIGILIALQINNWNENRKLLIKGQNYIVEIYKDLEKDTKVLTEFLSRLKAQSVSAEHILKVYDTPGYPIIDSLAFSQDFSLSSWPLVVDRDKNTYSDIVESGQSSIIRDDSLIEKLREYYKNYDSKIYNFNEYPKEVRFKKRAIAMQLGTYSNFKEFSENGQLNKEFLESWLNTKEFYPLILGIYKSCYYNIDFFEEVLLNTKSVMHYIEKNHADKILKTQTIK